jgi:hypothetical protein
MREEDRLRVRDVLRRGRRGAYGRRGLKPAESDSGAKIWVTNLFAAF